MDKLGGFGLIVVGLALVLLGWLVQSGIVEFLLDIVGIVIIIGGAIVGIIGIVKLVHRRRQQWRRVIRLLGRRIRTVWETHHGNDV